MNKGFVRTLAFVAILGLVLGSLTGFSCAGQHTRTSVGIPLAAQVLRTMQTDFARGIDDGLLRGSISEEQAARYRAEEKQLQDGLDAGDSSRVQLGDWGDARTAILGGILAREASGQIGSGVAGSLRERVANLDGLVNNIKGTR